MARIHVRDRVILTNGQRVNLRGSEVLWMRKWRRRRIRAIAFTLIALVALGGSLPSYLDTHSAEWGAWLVVAVVFGMAGLQQIIRGIPIRASDTGQSELLLRTRQGDLIVKEWGKVLTPTREALRLPPANEMVWRSIGDFDAYFWLCRYSKRTARRLFPKQPDITTMPAPKGFGFGKGLRGGRGSPV